MAQIDRKILIVEDDKFLLKALSDKLTREGFTVVLAVNGDEAMERIRSEKPDLVLLDLVMPHKDGFGVLEEMKLDKELDGIPVIILTNLGQDSDIKQGQELGAAEYLVKSNTPIKEIVEKIKLNLVKDKMSEEE